VSTLRWIGNAEIVTQRDTITIGVYDATTTYSVTINTKTYSTLGTGGTNATTAAALLALVQASAAGEFTEWTWTVNTNVITATQNTPGTPGTISAAATGGTGSISHVTFTANGSPSDVNNANNYSTGALPANTNDLILDWGDVPLEWNLSSLSGVTLNSLTRRQAFTGPIGLSETNANGYWEYRPTEWAISATTATIEQSSSDEAAGLKFNFGTAQTTLTIIGQGSGTLGEEVMYWRGTHAANIVNVFNGSLAIAPNGGQTATVATLNAEGSTVRCGSGTTLTTVGNLNSTMEFNSNVTTYTQNGQSAASYWKLAAAITTLKLNGGSVFWQSSGSLGTVAIGQGATLDFSQGIGPVTISGTVTLNAGASFLDPDARVTMSGSPSFSLAAGVTLDQVTINCGPGRNYTVV
jgi:hypothetical protein